MKIDKILPCVCCNHEPNSGDSVYYDGMPQLKVYEGYPDSFFSAFCPVCGIGGILKFKSAYLALMHWNDLHSKLQDTNFM